MREPAELIVDLGGVDGVAQVVTLAVGDVGDEAFGLAEPVADEADDLDVLHLVMAADVVDLAHAAVAHDQVHGLAVVLDIEPVPHVETGAVDGQGFVVQGVDDHEGDELLGEVVGAVVIGAAGDADREAVGAVVGQDQQVRRGFGGGVGAGGVDGRLLGEEEIGPVQGQVAVDLVRGDLVIARDAEGAAGVHQDGGADDVGLKEDGRVLDAAVHVALGGEVHHDVRVLLAEDAVYGLAVADIDLAEAEVRLLHDGGKGGEVARVGQLVQADDAVLRVLCQLIKDEVGADEAGPAGDDNGHGVLLKINAGK